MSSSSQVASFLPPTTIIIVPFDDETKEEPSTVLVSNSNSTSSPPCLRSALKKELARLSSSLTKHEHGFLEKLADDGDDDAVLRAHQRLSDDSLFFDMNHHHNHQQQQRRRNSISMSSNETLQVAAATARHDAKSAVSAPEGVHLPAIPTAVPLRRAIGSDGDVSSLGQDRRLEYLEHRKKSLLHGQIWRAHESGMPFRRNANNAAAARHSVTSSISGVSSSINAIQQAIANHHHHHHQQQPPIVPAKAGILRATSLLSVSQQERATEEAKIFRTSMSDIHNNKEQCVVADSSVLLLPPPLPPPIPPPDFKLGRGFSDGSRKSVTFNDVKQLRLFTRRASVDVPRTRRSSMDLPLAAAAMRPARMTRSVSVTEGIDLDAMFGASTTTTTTTTTTTLAESGNSFMEHSNNSLLAPKSKDDDMAAVDRIPPIRHPHHLESFSSLPSLHMAHSIYSDAASLANTSEVGSAITDSSVPRIRTAHSVRSDSLSQSGAVSWDMSEDSLAGGGGGAKEAFRKKYSEGWASPLPTRDEVLNMMKKPQVLLRPPPPTTTSAENLNTNTNNESSWQKPVLLRRTSQNAEEGEGIEVTEWEGGDSLSSSFRVDSLINARRYSSLLSLADSTTVGSIKTTLSYDEGPTYDRASDIFRIRKSFSDDEVANIFLGISRRLLKDNSSMYTEEMPEDDFDDASSWVDSEFSGGGHFDSWNVLKDEYENGYGGGGTLPFRILGTSSDDINSHPHVLSPPLMESLQNFLPWSLSESNFWMKYSMVRDGASMHSMLQHVRGSKYTILAIETMDGEVFGCFTTMPWRKNWNFFGSGESFLWRMRHSRQEKCHSIVDQAHMESEIDVYPWTQENNCFQLCTHNRIAVGGGSSVPENLEDDDDDEDPEVKAHEWGFGLTLDSDLMTGTTSPCATFGNPALSTVHSDGTRFEIINLEMWTWTPCGTLEDALKLELGHLFLEAHSE